MTAAVNNVYPVTIFTTEKCAKLEMFAFSSILSMETAKYATPPTNSSMVNAFKTITSDLNNLYASNC